MPLCAWLPCWLPLGHGTWNCELVKPKLPWWSTELPQTETKGIKKNLWRLIGSWYLSEAGSERFPRPIKASFFQLKECHTASMKSSWHWRGCFWCSCCSLFSSIRLHSRGSLSSLGRAAIPTATEKRKCNISRWLRRENKILQQPSKNLYHASWDKVNPSHYVVLWNGPLVFYSIYFC